MIFTKKELIKCCFYDINGKSNSKKETFDEIKTEKIKEALLKKFNLNQF